MSSIERVKPESIPTGLALVELVLDRWRNHAYHGHWDGTCYDCPFASPPLESDGYPARWEDISNDPTEAYFRCFLPGRDPSVVAWGEYAPCVEREWADAAMTALGHMDEEHEPWTPQEGDRAYRCDDDSCRLAPHYARHESGAYVFRNGKWTQGATA